LSYERSHCSILHSEPSRPVLETRALPYSSDRASDFLIAIGLKTYGPDGPQKAAA